MRINAGKWKGRVIYSVEGNTTRPTPDMVKQALFNIIRDRIDGADFCDLFAGTGNVAFEALSRGAKSAVLVENNRDAINVINKNIEKLACDGCTTVISKDVFIALKLMNSKKFDVIFFDPPYNQGIEKDVLQSVYDNNLLKGDGIVVVQYDAKHSGSIRIPEEFEITDERRYGRSAIVFLRVADLL